MTPQTPRNLAWLRSGGHLLEQGECPVAKKAKRYTAAFRANAVRMGVESDEPLTEVARRLGVNYATLYGWMEKAGETKATDTSARPGETVEEENRRLRREVETLRMERDFLKKATAFFARTSK